MLASYPVGGYNPTIGARVVPKTVTHTLFHPGVQSDGDGMSRRSQATHEYASAPQRDPREAPPNGPAPFYYSYFPEFSPFRGVRLHEAGGPVPGFLGTDRWCVGRPVLARAATFVSQWVRGGVLSSLIPGRPEAFGRRFVRGAACPVACFPSLPGGDRS